LDRPTFGTLRDRGLPNTSKTKLSAVKQAFVDANDSETEALVHVGTGLPVLALAEQVELDLGRPLIGCNAASYWQALRAMGIKHQVQGFGRLFAEF
jgi:maleate isomerase